MKLAGFTALSEETQKCFRGGLAGSVFSSVRFTMTQTRNRRMALVRERIIRRLRMQPASRNIVSLPITN